MALKTSIDTLKEAIGQSLQNVPAVVESAQRALTDVSTQAGGVDTDISGLKVDVSDIKNIIADNAGAHNAIYRGKNLGNSVTAAQYAAIEAGTFDDMYIGDYWEINSVKWRIAHFDYWLGTGDVKCTDHHVVIVPDETLYNSPMNAESETTGGYYSSAMRGGANYLIEDSSALYQAYETVKTTFGETHILTHRSMLSNAVTSGNASAWSWYDSKIEIMSELMIIGALAWSVGGKGFEIGVEKDQLELFKKDISKSNNNSDYWLRGICTSTTFVFMDSNGRMARNSANENYGVRPVFAIKGNTETRKPIPPSEPDER